MKNACLATIAAGMVAVATNANAETLTYDSYSWVGDGITVTSPNLISGGAGQIQLYNQGQLVADAWCMDVFAYLAGSGTVEIEPFNTGTVSAGVFGVPTTLTNDQLGEIGALALHGNDIMAHGGTADQSAEIQVAIWSVEYGDQFSYDSLGSSFADGVAQYIASVGPGTTWGENLGVQFLSPTGDGSQTLIAASAPETSTWVMMLAGFTGLGYAAYKRRNRDSIAAFA